MQEHNEGQEPPGKTDDVDAYLDGGSELTPEEREIARHQDAAQRSKRTAEEWRRLAIYRGSELARLREQNELLLAVKARREVPHEILFSKKRGTKNPTVSGSNLSDLHADEFVDPVKVHFKNESHQNLGMVEEKLDEAFRNTVRLYKKEAVAVDIRIHLAAFLGDFFSAHIHDDLIEATEMSPLQSLEWCLPRLKAGLRYLRSEMDCPLIWVIWKYGNHPRDTKKPRIIMASEHSYEHTLGRLLRQEMHEDAGFKFTVEPSYHTYIPLDGFVVRYSHGHYINFQGGIGGLTIPCNKAINEWNKTSWADLDVMAHWHETLDLPHLIMNSSLMGYSPFSIRVKGKLESPRGSFFLIDLERREKTGFFPIYATKAGE